MTQKVGHLHAGNRHRPLKGHEHAGPRPVVRLHRQDIEHRSVILDQLDLAVGHFVIRMPHDREAQRALARAVGSHQRVGLAAADFQIHALEDRPLD